MSAPQTPEERLQERAATIAKWDLEALIHPKLSAQGFNFEAQRELFETIQKFYADISTARFKCFPQNYLETMWNTAESMVKALTQVQDFNLRLGDPTQVMNQITAFVNQTWREAYERSSPHLAFARSFSGAVEEDIKAFQKTVADIKSRWESATTEFDNLTKVAGQQFQANKTDLEKVMAAARESARNSAVSAQATAFEDEAHSAWVASWVWLCATVFGIIAGFVLVYCLFLTDIQPQGTATIAARVNQLTTNNVAALPDNGVQGKVITATLLQQTIARILIVTLVYTAVVWCGRNYFAARHNYTVNRHRRNAMQTFQAFVAGSDDSGTRDFILRQAAQCAFSPQQSGYLKDESLPTPGPISQIMDTGKLGSS
jgi:hypothetical protein